jgi:hypothetical protein
MVSNLDPISMIFALSLSLFNNYIDTSAKWLGGSIINVHKNYGGFCIRSALRLLKKQSYQTAYHPWDIVNRAPMSLVWIATKEKENVRQLWLF